MNKKIKSFVGILVLTSFCAPTVSQAVLMIPPSAQKTPILVVPGIMGTEIYKGTEQLWPDINRMLVTPGDKFMDPLSYKGDGTPVDTSLTIGRVLRQPSTFFDYTQKLIDDLASQGYAEGVNLFLLPYDWRKDLGDVANHELKNRVDQIIAATGSQKIDIIAHSQGGLAAKRLIFDNPAYRSKIGKIIFVGTPHLGAPKAAKALLYGDSMGVSFLGLGLDPAEVKRISQNMPAVYELLPSGEYFAHSAGYLGGQNGIMDHSGTSQMLKDKGLNGALVDSADNFHDFNYDNFDFNGTGIEAYNLAGCQDATISRIIAKPDGKFSLHYGPGDSTVPIFSAANAYGANNYYALSTDHGSMLTKDGTRQLIINLVTGANLAADKITQDPTQCHFNGQAVSVHSPVQLSVYDEAGRHLGPGSSGNVDLEIPGAQYDVIGEEKFAFLPAGQSYTVNLAATDNGTFDFYSTQIRDSQPVSTAYYSDVPVTLGSTAKIFLDQSSHQFIEFTTEDRRVAPSSIFGAEKILDMVPPLTAATISGSQGQSGYYRSDVALILSATDPVVAGKENETSGLLKTQCKVDNADFQSCSGNPVNVSAEGVHTVTFFSTDLAGNREAEKVISFIIDKTPPEAAIQFNPAVKDLLFSGTDNLSSPSDIAVLDRGDAVVISDQAGNTAELKLKDKDRKRALKAEVRSLIYNGIPADITKTKLRFNWRIKGQALVELHQQVVSKRDFNLQAIYKSGLTFIQGQDAAGRIKEILNGLRLLVVKTDRGDFRWVF